MPPLFCGDPKRGLQSGVGDDGDGDDGDGDAGVSVDGVSVDGDGGGDGGKRTRKVPREVLFFSGRFVREQTDDSISETELCFRSKHPKVE
jgi:hypothetical protein